MTEYSYPFWAPATGNPSGKAMSEDQWAKMFRYVMNTGVMAVNFQDLLNELLVTPGSSANTINVDTGASWIQGHIYLNDSINTLGPIVPPASGTRADLIVLELKWGLDAGITAKIIPGTTNAIWPVGDPRTPNWMPTQPVTTYGVRWQLPLAQVNVTAGHATPFAQTDIVDWRVFTNSGGAKSSTYVVAAAAANPTIRANADAIIPYGSLDADWVINQAISTVATYGGGTVQLSEGTFNISSSILMQSNVNLRGLGNQTVLQCAGTMDPYTSTTSATTHAAVVFDATNNSTVAELAIMGRGAVPTPGVLPTGTTGYEGIVVYNGTLNSILDCNITLCKNYGVALRATSSSQTDCYGHKVERCYIANCANSGIFMQSNGGMFNNNQVDACTTGIQLFSDGSAGYGASINLVANNNVRDSMGYGILLQSVNAGSNVSQNEIDSNIISNSGQSNPIGSSGSIFANIYLCGTAMTAINLISNNHSQGFLPRQPAYALMLDGLVDYNFIHGNFLYSGGYAACNGHGGTHNRMYNNFGYADYGSFNG